MNAKLLPYVEIVKFLGAALGENVEIALHDLTSKDREVVAIENGKISNRKVGAGLSNLALHMLETKQYESNDYVFNYKTVGGDGKLLRSSTYFIKDGKELVGMLCINVDITDYEYMNTTLKKILGINEAAPTEYSINNPIEILSNSLEDTVERYIKEALENIGFPSYYLTERLKAHEKKRVVKYLQDKGTFKVKGALACVANRLGVSEPTVYRYLKKK